MLIFVIATTTAVVATLLRLQTTTGRSARRPAHARVCSSDSNKRHRKQRAA